MTREELDTKIEKTLDHFNKGFLYKGGAMTDINYLFDEYLQTALAEQHKKTRYAAIEVVQDEIYKVDESGISQDDLLDMTDDIVSNIQNLKQ